MCKLRRNCQRFMLHLKYFAEFAKLKRTPKCNLMPHWDGSSPTAYVIGLGIIFISLHINVICNSNKLQYRFSHCSVTSVRLRKSDSFSLIGDFGWVHFQLASEVRGSSNKFNIILTVVDGEHVPQIWWHKVINKSIQVILGQMNLRAEHKALHPTVYPNNYMANEVDGVLFQHMIRFSSFITVWICSI
jgi:hypothetical protein